MCDEANGERHWGHASAPGRPAIFGKITNRPRSDRHQDLLALRLGRMRDTSTDEQGGH